MKIRRVLVAALLWVTVNGLAAPASPAANRPPEGQGMGAVEKASAAKQHLFVFFYDSESESTRAARKVFDDAMRSLGSSVQSAAVDRRAPAEQPIVGRFGINTSPMPLVLVVAPNGAVTAGVEAKDLSEQRLRGALATPAEQECLSQLQKQRMVVVCIQNGRTKSNESAMKGVEEFKGDVQFARFVRLVKIDPDDKAEKSFLAKLSVDPKTPEATTVVLAPPGAVVGTFRGPTQKNTLVALVRNPPQPCCGPVKGGGSTKDCAARK